MNGAQTVESLFQTRRQRFIGRIHAGKHRVAAIFGKLARDQNGAHGRLFVIGMIGVPAAANIGELILFLPHLRDLRILAIGGEEAVDVDLAPAPRERNMLLGRQLLVAKEDHPIVGEGLADFFHLAV